MRIKKNSIVFCLLFFAITFNFFMPTFNSMLTENNSLGAALINAGLFVILLPLVLISFSSDYEHIYNNLIYIAFSMAMLWLVLIIIAILFSGSFIARDLFEVHRPPLYFLSFVTGVSLASLSEERRHEIFKFIFVSLFIIALFGVAQFFSFVDTLTSFYSKAVNVHSHRAVGTFVNPYDFAYILLFPVIFYFIKSILVSLYNFPFFIFYSCVLFFTQSKMGMIVYALTIPLCWIIAVRVLNKWRNMKRLQMLFLLGFLLILGCIWGASLIDWSHVIERFSYSLNGIAEFSEGKNNSFNIRLQQISSVLEDKSSFFSIVLGSGIQKEMMSYLENEYLLFFFRYGVVGVLLLLFVIIPPVFKFNRLVRFSVVDCKSKNDFLILLTIWIWLFVTLIALVNNAFLDIIRNQFFYYSMLGYFWGQMVTSNAHKRNIEHHI